MGAGGWGRGGGIVRENGKKRSNMFVVGAPKESQEGFIKIIFGNSKDIFQKNTESKDSKEKILLYSNKISQY